MQRRNFLKLSSTSPLFLPLSQYETFTDIESFFISLTVINQNETLALLYNSLLVNSSDANLVKANTYLLYHKSLEIQYQMGLINGHEVDLEMQKFLKKDDFILSRKDYVIVHKSQFNGISTYENIKNEQDLYWGVLGGIGVAATAVTIILGGALLLPAAATVSFGKSAALITYGLGLYAAATSLPDYFIGNIRKNQAIQFYRTMPLVYDFCENRDNIQSQDILSQMQKKTNLFLGIVDKPIEDKLSQIKNQKTKKLIEKVQDENLGKEELLEILGEYVEILGEENQKILDRYFISQTPKPNYPDFYKDAQIERQELNMLYSAFGNALNTIASEIFGQREARVFSVIVNSTTQMLIQGSAFGPYGWAAVALNIGISLFSNSGPSFEEILMKAIIQIQKQLNFIVEKLYRLEQNQRRLFEAIGRVYDLLQKNNGILTKGIKELINNQQEILRQLNQNQEFSERNSYFEANNRLKLSLKDGLDLSPQTILLEVVKLQEYIKFKLKQPVFTNYSDGIISGSQLKKLIFYYSKNDSQKKLLVSFYDFVGLIPIAYNYDFKVDQASSGNELANLYQVNFTVNDILNWFSYGKINKRRQKIILDDVSDYLEKTRLSLNEYANKSKIESLVNNYSKTVETLLQKLSQIFLNHRKSTFDKPLLSDNIFLSSDDNFFVDSQQYRKIQDFFESPIDMIEHKRRSGKYYQFDEFVKNGKILYSDWVSSQWINNPKPVPGHQIIPLVTMRPGYAQPSMDWDLYDVLFEMKIFSEKRDLALNADYSNNHYMSHYRVKGNFLGYNIDFILYQKFYTANIPNYGSNIRRYDMNVHLEHKYRDEIDYKEKLRVFLKESYQVDLDTIYPCYLEKLTFLEFMTILLNEKLKEIKKEVINLTIKEIEKLSILDGCGISTLLLTKLNILICQEDINYFDSNHFDLLFMQEDFIDLVQMLENSSVLDYLESLRETFNKSIEEGTDLPNYYISKNKFGNTSKLNPNSFYDLILISLNQKIQKTLEYVRESIADVKTKDSEPFIADSINKINNFRRFIS